MKKYLLKIRATHLPSHSSGSLNLHHLSYYYGNLKLVSESKNWIFCSNSPVQLGDVNSGFAPPLPGPMGTQTHGRFFSVSFCISTTDQNHVITGKENHGFCRARAPLDGRSRFLWE